MSDGFPLTRQFEPAEIESRVAPKLVRPLSAFAYDQLSRYLELLYRWNQQINLTAVRDPIVLMELHLSECLRAAQRIPAGVESVLDFGSGAGLPGVPIQIARPDLRVTFAESQKKKAIFLREVLRVAGMTQASVHSGRVESMPVGQTFDLVTLRAVDKMAQALEVAATRIHPLQSSRSPQKGWCLVLTSQVEAAKICAKESVSAVHSVHSAAARPYLTWLSPEPVPGTDQRVLLLGYRSR